MNNSNLECLASIVGAVFVAEISACAMPPDSNVLIAFIWGIALVAIATIAAAMRCDRLLKKSVQE